jgi:hypothetical protein
MTYSPDDITELAHAFTKKAAKRKGVPAKRNAIVCQSNGMTMQLTPGEKSRLMGPKATVRCPYCNKQIRPRKGKCWMSGKVAYKVARHYEVL